MIRTSAVLFASLLLIACSGSAVDGGAAVTDTAVTDTTVTDTGAELPPIPSTDATDTASPPTPDTAETDTVEPPLLDVQQPPNNDTTAPEDTTEPPDTAEPPTPDTAEPPTPDTAEPPTPDTAEPPTPDTAEPPEPEAVTWTTHIQSIITSRCAPCHTTQSKGQLKIKSYATMLEPSPKCYSGLNVAESIKLKVQPSPGCKNQMPPTGKLPLTDSQIQQIIDWVDAGYPE